MAFHLKSHHQLEALADEYLVQRGIDLGQFRQGGVFGKEVVVVPTYGVEVWLEHHLVRRGIVVAGIDFPILRTAICDLLQATVPEYRPEAFLPGALTWRIYRIFCEEIGAEDFPPLLKKYLAVEDEVDPQLRKYEFAKVVAQLFEEYQSYLPHTLANWGRGDLLDEVINENTGQVAGPLAEAQKWQSRLWWRLCNPNGTSGGHLVSLAEAIVTFLDAKRTECPNYPITIFGASTMPPAFLAVLLNYAKSAEVNFFYRNPCQEFYADNVPDKIAQLKSKFAEDTEELLKNDLLANNGRLAQEFFKTILDKFGEGETVSGKPEAEDIQPTTLLAVIQRQIVENTNPEYADVKLEKLASDDDSLTFHSCFNTMREVEALRDALLLLLKNNPNYTLNDIIVMAPDIASFAPAIRAVFDSCALKSHYSLSDQSIKQANLLAAGFLELLQFHTGHFEVSRVARLLEVQPLRNRFHLDEAAVQAIRNWISEANIRLDYDLKSRKRALGLDDNQFDDEAFTWQLGLDRLLLSLAVEPSEDKEDDTLQYGELAPLAFSAKESDENQTLGALCALLQKLRRLGEKIKEKEERSPEEWQTLLQEIVTEFFQADADSALDHFTLGNCINHFVSEAKDGDYSGKIPFSIVFSILQGALETAIPKTPFLSGKITCCSMLPMREVPCKVLAILGMEAGNFPHRDNKPGFTLLARDSKLPYYVKSRVQEDQYIFLEAIQAVQDKLLIFYHGQDDKEPDSSSPKLLPAPLVEELMAYAVRVCRNAVEPVEAPEEKLLQRHPLNAFDAKNFRASSNAPTSLREAFSFDQLNAKVGARLMRKQSGKGTEEAVWKSYFQLPMPEQFPVPMGKDGFLLELTDLERFFKDPITSFLERRLDFAMKGEEKSDLQDIEPFALEAGLEAYNVKNTIFTEQILLGKKDSGMLRKLRRTSRLPLAGLGEQVFRKTLQEMNIPENDALSLWRKGNQTQADFSLDLEVPRDLFTGFEDLSKLRGKSNRELPWESAGETVQVRVHANLEVATDGEGNQGIVNACLSSELKPRHKLVPYLRWLALACASKERTPFLKIWISSAGEVSDLSAVFPMLENLTCEQLQPILTQVVQLYLLGLVIPLPLQLDEYKIDGPLLVFGEEKLKNVKELPIIGLPNFMGPKTEKMGQKPEKRKGKKR